MAIDAVIERTRQLKYDLRLELAPRVDAEGQDTCPGRRSLLIVGPRSFEPQVGMEIWGSADSVQIVGGAEYERRGTFLRESRNCLRCFARLHWVTIVNRETGHYREAFRCRECGHEERF